MKWIETTFGDFVECNPLIKARRNALVENCEMEDINVQYKYLYPQNGKIYIGSGSKFQNGDTVFSRITPCLENGKIAQIKGLKRNIGVGSTEFFVFRGKKMVSDNDFVYYLSKTHYIRKSAENSMFGASGRQRADLGFIKGRKVIVPESISDQQKIADILSRYDDLIETNNRRIALLEESARELYKEWFVRMRFPGYEQTKFVNGMPKGWKTVRLSSVVQYVSERVYVDSIKLYVSTDSMAKDYGGLDISSLTEPVESNVIKFRVNDILVSNIRPYFKKIWFANCNGGCSSDVLVIRAKNSKYQLYVYYSICNDYFFDYMMAGANGTKMPRGNKDFTVTFSLFIPNEELIN